MGNRKRIPIKNNSAKFILSSWDVQIKSWQREHEEWNQYLKEIEEEDEKEERKDREWENKQRGPKHEQFVDDEAQIMRALRNGNGDLIGF